MSSRTRAEQPACMMSVLLICAIMCVVACEQTGVLVAPAVPEARANAQPSSRSFAAVAPASASAVVETETQHDEGPPLFARYPRLANVLAYARLGKLPTPVSRAAALGVRIGVPTLYVKHDDQAGDPYGGNKVRKLEFVLAEAKRQGRTGVMTFGGVGSNHALCTAVFAQKLGLSATLLLLPEPNTEHVREHLLADVKYGAHVQMGSNERIARLTARASRGELGPEELYVIPAGGTSPLGNVGFVNAAFELQEQVNRGELPEPDEIFIAAGTGGSAVGLAVGLSVAGMHTRVRAVRVSSTRYVTSASLAEQFEQTVALLRGADDTFPSVEHDPNRLIIVDGYVGRGYALPTQAAQRAASLAASEAGLELDATYTAKTMAAVMSMANELAEGAVLFWYTYDPRRIDVSGVGIEDVPAAFRGYFAGR